MTVVETVKAAVGLGEGASTCLFRPIVQVWCFMKLTSFPWDLVAATREAMSEARLPLAYRDGCAGLLIPLNRCRYEEYYLPWKCEVSFCVFSCSGYRIRMDGCGGGLGYKHELDWKRI